MGIVVVVELKCIIADGEPPVIYGMEMLENRELIDRRDGKVNVTITASDGAD